MKYYPEATKVVLMLAHRLRRWTNIKTTLVQRILIVCVPSFGQDTADNTADNDTGFDVVDIRSEFLIEWIAHYLRRLRHLPILLN